MKPGLTLLMCSAAAALLAGGCNPFAQLKADSIARAAIEHIREGDAEQLAPLLSRPQSASSVVARIRPAIPLGKIEYRGDDALFLMTTYRRYYLVLPDPARDRPDAHAARLAVDFVDDPIRIDSIFVDLPDLTSGQSRGSSSRP